VKADCRHDRGPDPRLAANVGRLEQAAADHARKFALGVYAHDCGCLAWIEEPVNTATAVTRPTTL
jgi:hypothetical protein